MTRGSSFVYDTTYRVHKQYVTLGILLIYKDI